jgi:hypothetical protein
VEGGDSRGNKRDGRDPGLSVAREAARRSPAGKRPPATEIHTTVYKHQLTTILLSMELL